MMNHSLNLNCMEYMNCDGGVVVWRVVVYCIKNTYGIVTTTAYVSHYFLNRENPF